MSVITEVLDNFEIREYTVRHAVLREFIKN